MLFSSSAASGFSGRYHKQANVDDRSKKDSALVKHVHMSLYPFHSSISNSAFVNQQPCRVEKQYGRGTFSTGVLDGYGFLYATPWAANDVTGGFIGYSAGAAATAYDQFANATYVSALNGSTPMASFSVSGYNSRIISCGIRVRNITPMLNRGGTLFALRSPNDEALGFSTNISNLISRMDTSGNAWRASTSGDKWEYISWAPRDSDQMEFGIGFTGLTPRAASMGGPVIAFAAQQPSGVQQTYEWEYVCIYELIVASQSGGQSLTRGTANPQIEECLQAVYELSKRPEVAGNEVSVHLAPFVADCVKAGHDIESIVSSGIDLVNRTVSALPPIYNALKSLGSWL